MQLGLKLRNKKTDLTKLIVSKQAQIVESIVIVFLTLLLFVLALYVKNAFHEWYYYQEGINFYWYYDPNDSQAVWYIEGYVDASYYYQPYLYAFRYQNWNPYSGGEGPLNGYAYGPLFIYGLYFISLFVSMFNPSYTNDKVVIESVKWTHIVFDALCVSLLYIIIINLDYFKSKRYSKHFFGVLLSLIYIWIPFNLIYVDSLSLNIPQMTFFTLLSLLFFLKEKYTLSSFFLTIAWLSKQMPLFLVIPWFLILWKKENNLKKALLDFLLPFFFMTCLFSIPWVFLEPYSYIFRLFGPGKPLDFVSLSAKYNGYTVTLAHSFLKLGSETLANFYLVINKYMIPFFLFYMLSLLIAYFNGKQLFSDETQFLVYTTLVILVTHVFISRGIYKYYDAFFSPFFLLCMILLFSDFLSHIEQKQKKLIVDEEKVGRTFCIIENINMSLHSKTFLYNVLLFFYLIFSSFILYYVDWIIITKSRFLHPLYLLLIFIFLSTMLKGEYYSSLFKKANYKMIWTDIVEIIQRIRQSLHIKKKMKIKQKKL
ncbi:MAG: hypothetical protein ACTSQE_12080 [Candidatus Heimdallarchaeaceae archaeon]